MTQQARASGTSVHTREVRAKQVRLGIWIELLTLLWMMLEAGIAFVYFIVREGREALHEARTGETCSCSEEECE